MNREQKIYKFGEEMLSTAELSRRTGISRSTLRTRWSSGKRDESLVAPVDRSEASRIAARYSHASQAQNLLFDSEEEAYMSYEDIAAELGLSVSSVYRIKRMALAKIRRQLGLS